MTTFVGAEYLVANLFMAKSRVGKELVVSFGELVSAGVLVHKRSLRHRIKAVFLTDFKPSVYNFSNYFKWTIGDSYVRLADGVTIKDLETRFYGYLPFEILVFLVTVFDSFVNGDVKEGLHMLQIKVKYLNPEVNKLKKIKVGDWIDLFSAENVKLKKGELHYIGLGVAMELPKGYEAWLVARSSMAKKFKIQQSNSIGVIDSSYCGDTDEWKLPVVALEDTEIHVNDRICQFRIHETMPEIAIEEVDTLGNPDRGGFGSTGY